MVSVTDTLITDSKDYQLFWSLEIKFAGAMSVVINIVPGNLCLIVKSFTKRFFVTILAGSHYDYLVIILSLYSWSAGGINKTRIKEIAAVSFCRCQAYV